MAALSSAELQEAAASPLARPSAAQLLPGAQSAEGIPRLERLLVAAAKRAPKELTGAAVDLVRAGGKRVRPLLLLLSARAAAPRHRARGRVALALVAEMVHSATLLHDDVIDDGLTRRGLPAPRVAYGNGVSVIAGDWLLAASLELVLRASVPEAMPALVRTLRQLVEGESRQIALRGRTDFTSDDALQIADDLLDFESDAATLGKAALADVTEGKPSLPLAIALKRLPPLRQEMAGLLAPESGMPEEEVRARVRSFATRLS